MMDRCTAPSSSRARCCRLAPTPHSSHALGRRGWGAVVAVVPPAPDGPGPVLAAFREVVSAGARRPGRRAQQRRAVRRGGRRGRSRWSTSTPRCRRSTATRPWPRRGCSTTSPASPTTTGCCRRGPAGGTSDDLAAVVPDPAVLAGIRDEEPRMPLAYFRSRLGAPDGWVDAPAGLPRARRHLRRGDRVRARLRLAHDGARGRAAPAPPRRPGCRGRRGARPRRRARPAAAQERAWSRGDDHGVTGRGTATPSSSRSVRSE